MRYIIWFQLQEKVSIPLQNGALNNDGKTIRDRARYLYKILFQTSHGGIHSGQHPEQPTAGTMKNRVDGRDMLVSFISKKVHDEFPTSSFLIVPTKLTVKYYTPEL